MEYKVVRFDITGALTGAVFIQNLESWSPHHDWAILGAVLGPAGVIHPRECGGNYAIALVTCGSEPQ